MTPQAALCAIVARIQGEWDNPLLVAYGALGNTLDDVLNIAQAGLRTIGATQDNVTDSLHHGGSESRD